MEKDAAIGLKFANGLKESGQAGDVMQHGAGHNHFIPAPLGSESINPRWHVAGGAAAEAELLGGTARVSIPHGRASSG